jgi:hypothetical protein
MEQSTGRFDVSGVRRTVLLAYGGFRGAGRMSRFVLKFGGDPGLAQAT